VTNQYCCEINCVEVVFGSALGHHDFKELATCLASEKTPCPHCVRICVAADADPRIRNARQRAGIAG